jgi:hypothetical protein
MAKETEPKVTTSWAPFPSPGQVPAPVEAPVEDAPSE